MIRVLLLPTFRCIIHIRPHDQEGQQRRAVPKGAQQKNIDPGTSLGLGKRGEQGHLRRCGFQ